MTSQLVLPPLNRWAENNISELYSAQTQEQFNSIFDGFVAPNADIVVNGSRISRDQYKQVLESQRALERSASVKFGGVVATKPPQVNTPEKDIPVGLVGVFYDATISENLHEGGVPLSRTVKSSLNIAVDKDSSVIIPPGGARDARRAVTVNQVFTTDNAV